MSLSFAPNRRLYLVTCNKLIREKSLFYLDLVSATYNFWVILFAIQNWSNDAKILRHFQFSLFDWDSSFWLNNSLWQCFKFMFSFCCLEISTLANLTVGLVKLYTRVHNFLLKKLIHLIDLFTSDELPECLFDGSQVSVLGLVYISSPCYNYHTHYLINSRQDRRLGKLALEYSHCPRSRI